VKKSLLRVAVRAALEAPHNKPALQRWLGSRLPPLRRSVRIPAASPLRELERFARDYMQRLPDYIATVERLAGHLGVTEPARPLLQLANSIALDAAAPVPDQPRTAGQLVDLLHVSYFAYRLVEETIDYCVAASGGPQLPHAMTVATLICHDLIGEPFANELDAAVTAVVESWLVGRALPNPARAPRASTVQWPQPAHNLALAGRFGLPN
jgi:hypothetical protein